jgi:hypothetical protein
MPGTLRVSRSRGAFSGVMLILLGLWGGLVPLVGPYLHYAYTPDRAWAMTSGRIWLEFLPAAATIVGGIMVAASKLRPSALLGACIAAVSGGWFAFGAVITRLVMRTPPVPGTPVGGTFIRPLEQIGFFTGLGAVIVLIAAIAIGRLSVISVRDDRLAQRTARTDSELVTASTSGPKDRVVTVPDSEVTAPTPVTTVPAPAETVPTPAATAPLVRIASRNKTSQRVDEDSDGADNSTSKDPVTSGTLGS